MKKQDTKEIDPRAIVVKFAPNGEIIDARVGEKLSPFHITKAANWLIMMAGMGSRR